MLTGATGVAQCYVNTSGTLHYFLDTSIQVIHSAQSFAQWYADSELSTKVTTNLELNQVGTSAQFQISSSNGHTIADDIHDIFLALPTSGGTPPAGAATALTSGFFLLEDTGRPKVCNIWPYWLSALQTAATCRATSGTPVPSQWDPRAWYGSIPPAQPTGGPVAPVPGLMRNYYFTSEARFYFRFSGGESLDFLGNDDVWIFVNGHLVLDMGATHIRLQGTFSIASDATASWTVRKPDWATGTSTTIASGTASLGLVTGEPYEVAVFQAERQPRDSNYQLTLSGFRSARSVCVPQ